MTRLERLRRRQAIPRESSNAASRPGICSVGSRIPVPGCSACLVIGVGPRLAPRSRTAYARRELASPAFATRVPPREEGHT